MKNKTIIMMLVGCMVACVWGVCSAASDQQIERAVTQAAHQATWNQMHAQTAGLSALATTWKRCDVYEHHRRLRIGGTRAACAWSITART